MNFIVLGILAYIALQLLMGALIAPRIRTEDDFLLAAAAMTILVMNDEKTLLQEFPRMT